MTLLETSVPPRGMTRASAIRTTGLRKVYPLPAQKRGPSSAASRAVAATAGSPGTPSGVVALDALDLEIRSGEFFGVLGPNGAGKTTTLGILTTRVLPTAGEARVSGLDVVRDSVGVRRLIGVVPQRPESRPPADGAREPAVPRLVFRHSSRGRRVRALASCWRRSRSPIAPPRAWISSRAASSSA